MTSAAKLRLTVQAVWRMESARIVGSLTRLLRDVGTAESWGPVVELNRAVALAAMAFRPTAGLEIADAVPDGQRPKYCHLLPCVRGDLPHRLGRLDEARVEADRAAALTRNERERASLKQRAAGCA